MSGSLREATGQVEPGVRFPVPGVGLAPAVLSTAERESGTFGRLLRILEAHVAAEADSLSTYLALAGHADDPVVGLLLQLLTEDAARHHELLRRLAATIRDGLYWTHSPEALPGPARDVGGEHEELEAAVRESLREERESARHFE